MPDLPPRESRFFPALAILAIATILALLPARYELMPRGLQFLIAAALAIPMLIAGYAPNRTRWLRIERYVASIILPLTTALQLLLLAKLLIEMASKDSHASGLTLLTTSVAIWITNALVFALAYWLIDRGGPEGRESGWKGWADFSFTRGDPSEGMPVGWQPIFADYFALAFNTSSAFSPTDVLPLRPRAKVLMVIQSFISLITVIAVGARAINILGS
ncbi:MAG TPA: hypothetical protein VHR97_06860 [Candidatus Baltobacteraceae bacterium]|nr:hypothetical protein [Candidatus Baltobacteraceae bacterium]